jgi:hypothetical protein
MEGWYVSALSFVIATMYSGACNSQLSTCWYMSILEQEEHRFDDDMQQRGEIASKQLQR